MFTVDKRKSGENNKNYSYRVIKDAIMFLELKPGQAISEVELAEKLKISRTPIREVLTQLKEENLIDVIPQVGTYVTKLNPQLIEEAAFMRFILEREIIKMSCEAFPDEYLQKLKRNLMLQDLLINQESNEREFHRLDTEFHKIIFQANSKEHIWEAIARLSTHYNRIRLISELQFGFSHVIEEHHEIVRIIESHEVNQADKIVRKHILEPTKKWKKLITEDSPFYDYFDINERSLY
jgi:DNA-binding GntR family transcriptional regulator